MRQVGCALTSEPTVGRGPLILPGPRVVEARLGFPPPSVEASEPRLGIWSLAIAQLGRALALGARDESSNLSSQTE